MKSKEVLRLLQITRPTLCSYVKSGKLPVKQLPNGFYDYDDDTVYKLAGISEQRKCVIYGRVSTKNQEKCLQNQINNIKQFANKNGYIVNNVYYDIASGLSYDRKQFMQMLKEILNYNIKTVIVDNKDRLTRVSFNMWKQLFKYFNCELIVVNEDIKTDNNDKEIFYDIISLLHCFAMKMYSLRRKKKCELISEDLNNE